MQTNAELIGELSTQALAESYGKSKERPSPVSVMVFRKPS